MVTPTHPTSFLLEVEPNGLTKLEQLHLWDTKITDAGREHLTGLTNLEQIELSQTPVTDASVAELKMALPKCNVLGGRRR